MSLRAHVTRLVKLTIAHGLQVTGLLDDLNKLIGKNLQGAGLFTLPGLLKIKVTRKPATPARKGINPFTKEECVFKAKPARNVIKVRPLKALKDMAR
jgi:nucleoid DNA-binding protein